MTGVVEVKLTGGGYAAAAVVVKKMHVAGRAGAESEGRVGRGD